MVKTGQRYVTPGGVEMVVTDFSNMRAGDDAEQLQFFNLNSLPEIVFDCHNKFIL